jgi:antitoxin FitA
MSAITVRRLPEGVKQRLRLRAAANGRSMEAEARHILVDALHADRRVDLDWVDGLMAVGAEFGGVEVPDVPDDAAGAARFDGS